MKIKHIAAAVIVLAACLWLVPGIPLVDEEVSADKLTVLHIEMGPKQTADHSVETYIEPLKYTFTADDQEFQQILDILQQNTCRRTLRGLLGVPTLGGDSSTSEYQILIAIYDEEGLITNILYDGEGGVLRDRAYRMNRKVQQAMMEELRTIYQP